MSILPKTVGVSSVIVGVPGGSTLELLCGEAHVRSIIHGGFPRPSKCEPADRVCRCKEAGKRDDHGGPTTW